jgi:hypothetical protein
MKILRLFALGLLIVVLTLLACGGQSTTTTATTPLPTTSPLQAVEAAIWAANEKDYDKANQLLDVSAVAQASGQESTTEYWDWITSSQRVAEINIEEKETKEEARHLFITLKNDNYPGLNVAFWIRWEGDRWLAFDDNS